MIRVRFVGTLLLVALSLSVTACAAPVFVPVPPPRASTGELPSGALDAGTGVTAPAVGSPRASQMSGAAELLGSIVTPTAPQHPDLTSLAPAPDTGTNAPETPDFGRMAELMNSAKGEPQLLSDRQARGRNRLYEALQARSSAIFVLDTPRCAFDSAQGFVLYENSYMNLKAQEVQSDIRSQLQEMYFRAQGGTLAVDVTPGGGPARVQLQNDGTVALGWLGQSNIGTKQIVGLVGDDQMALQFESHITTVINGARGGRTASGRLLCPMTWLAQSDWPPQPPYNVQIQSTPQRCLVVSWQPNTTTGVQPAGYIVARYLSTDQSFREVASVTTTYYQDCSREAVSETSFAYYYVVAVSRNNRRSVPSEITNIQLIDRMLPSWGR